MSRGGGAILFGSSLQGSVNARGSRGRGLDFSRAESSRSFDSLRSCQSSYFSRLLRSLSSLISCPFLFVSWTLQVNLLLKQQQQQQTKREMAKFQVDSPNVTYGDRYIEADYDYCTSRVEPASDGRYKVTCKLIAIFHQPNVLLSMRV